MNDHKLRGVHEDNRNEAAARLRAAVRAEEVRARWCRRIEPLMPTGSLPSDDFEGCTE